MGGTGDSSFQRKLPYLASLRRDPELATYVYLSISVVDQ